MKATEKNRRALKPQAVQLSQVWGGGGERNGQSSVAVPNAALGRAV